MFCGPTDQHNRASYRVADCCLKKSRAIIHSLEYTNVTQCSYQGQSWGETLAHQQSCQTAYRPAQRVARATKPTVGIPSRLADRQAGIAGAASVLASRLAGRLVEKAVGI